MHAFTLTFHTHLFGKNLPDKDLEVIAIEYAGTIEELMHEHGLNRYFETEISWKRGSLLVYISYIPLDPETWIAAAKAATAGVTGIAAFFAAYGPASEGYEKFKEDLKKRSIKKGDVCVNVGDFYEDEAPPPTNSNIIPIESYRKK